MKKFGIIPTLRREKQIHTYSRSLQFKFLAFPLCFSSYVYYLFELSVQRLKIKSLAQFVWPYKMAHLIIFDKQSTISNAATGYLFKEEPFSCFLGQSMGLEHLRYRGQGRPELCGPAVTCPGVTGSVQPQDPEVDLSGKLIAFILFPGSGRQKEDIL